MAYPRLFREPRPVRFITTKSGVRIGSAYTPPPPRAWKEEEEVQRAILTPPPRAVGPRPRLWRMLVEWL